MVNLKNFLTRFKGKTSSAASILNPRNIRSQELEGKILKQFYQIHELAKLFDLCPDTLRYYEEKGLLHPVRGENRYRMYGIQDVCTLNIIRSLRELGIPTRSIRAYLERRSVGETLTLLDREEEELLRRRMAELEAALKEAQNRRSRLEQYRNAAAGQVELVQEAERPMYSWKRILFWRRRSTSCSKSWSSGTKTT